MLQLILFTVGIFATLVLVLVAFWGPSEGKAQSRRLGGIRERHADGVVSAEAHMRKVISQRPAMMSGDQKKGLLPSRQALAHRLEMTGKPWQLKQLGIAAAGIFIVMTGLLLFKGTPVLLALLVGAMLGLFIPHTVINFLIKKRINLFNVSFPDAIELMVRGLRSGLPISETLSVVGQELPGPAGVEFRGVTDRIRIGKSMEESLQQSADRMGTPEFQFFCITLAIQRETGGNLAETLSNLAEVLRKRAQMKLKIRAMSSESKASAYIVGSLPFIVFALIWFMNPKYLAGFFFEERLIIAGLGGLLWMSIGVFIMAKMVSFEI